MAKGKTHKGTIKKAHRIARAIIRTKRSKKVRNPWAVGMAAAKGQARRRRGRRKR